MTRGAVPIWAAMETVIKAQTFRSAVFLTGNKPYSPGCRSKIAVTAAKDS